MTKKRLIEKLNDLLYESDIEVAHVKADKLLLEFIDDKDVSEAFDEIEKWYA